MDNTFIDKHKDFQLKQQLVALYLNQRVLFSNADTVLFNVNGKIIDSLMNREYLVLRSLSQITDTEAIELAKKRGYMNIKNVRIENDGYWVKFLGNTQKTVFVFFTELYGSEVDYIRSQGFAYAFNGISVEKQIENEWVKIKES